MCHGRRVFRKTNFRDEARSDLAFVVGVSLKKGGDFDQYQAVLSDVWTMLSGREWILVDACRCPCELVAVFGRCTAMFGRY